MLYSIANFSFLGLESLAGRGGAPLLPHEMIELVQRPGVNGTGFVLMGAKGFAFPMRSWVDCASEADAHTLMTEYRALVGNDLQTIVYRNYDFGVAHNVKYCVLGVTEDRIEDAAVVVGGLNIAGGASGVTLNAIWHLLPVEVEP